MKIANAHIIVIFLAISCGFLTQTFGQRPTSEPAGSGTSSKKRPPGVSLEEVRSILSDLSIPGRSRPPNNRNTINGDGDTWPLPRTLSETVDWLEMNLNRNAHAAVSSGKLNRSFSSSFIGYEDCILRWRESDTGGVTQISTDTSDRSIDFRFVDAITTQRANWNSMAIISERAFPYHHIYEVTMRTRGDHVTVKGSIQGNMRGSSAALIFGNENVDNKELVTNVAKAFERLKGVCSNREYDPF